MTPIEKIRSVSIWIFIIPFLSINTCLLIVTQFHQILEPGVPIFPTFPYIDGGVSISRTVREYPLYLIFKPAMFITSFLLIIYWYNNKKLIKIINTNYKNKNKIIFFGVASAILLAIHSIFLGIKIEYDLYKLFRRVVMLSFIIFELIAQFYLIKFLYDHKNKIQSLINEKFLFIKKILIHLLISISIITIPFLPFNNFKFLKHALEWNVFLGVIIFYLLTRLMWKRIN